MIATTGWVEGIDTTGALIKLKAGPTVRIPRMPGLKWGESVRVFWNEKTNHIGSVQTLDDLHYLYDPKELTWSEACLPWENPTAEEIVDDLMR